ncbi:hypothetical protein [Hyphomicrobium sp. ghe19]|uniref:hypothetical protein n=1 Tax=Hyphomicrobium sp. ghe19 TaxID=2682968 RepID=UPI001367002B|nr:hypothetical protein HYPP_04050 [Hyphomicrobium sp. ghe19]
MGKVLATQSITPGWPPHGFRVGVEDVFILPLVAVAFAVNVVLRGLLRILINIIDGLFPLLLQVMRFPLFTSRILGDGIVALLKSIMQILPIGEMRRQALRDFIGRNWAWLRRYLSYRVFEERLHDAFENAMASVFRKCRKSTPLAALLMLIGAVLWLPISFAVATLMHTLLLAWAASLPSWMQLLHPVATVIAKSKLLVLPVYPAAWPQAKQHPIVQAMFRSWRYLLTVYLVQKTGFRYRQTELAAARAAGVCSAAASAIGASQLLRLLQAGIKTTAAIIGYWLRALLASTIATLAPLSLFGGIVRRLVERYEEVSRRPTEPLSDKVGDFFARWSIKFSAEYYEAREREGNGHSGGDLGAADRQ